MATAKSWVQTGPPEAPDEAIHTRVSCKGCGNVFGEYLIATNLGTLIPIGHENNELPAEPDWKRVSPRAAGVRGPLTGAAAYKLERFEGKIYVRWTCRGRQQQRCRARPKIEWEALVNRLRRLTTQTQKRPIETPL